MKTTAADSFPIDSFARISVTTQQMNKRTRNCGGREFEQTERWKKCLFNAGQCAHMIEGEKLTVPVMYESCVAAWIGGEINEYSKNENERNRW